MYNPYRRRRRPNPWLKFLGKEFLKNFNYAISNLSPSRWLPCQTQSGVPSASNRACESSCRWMEQHELGWESSLPLEPATNQRQRSSKQLEVLSNRLNLFLNNLKTAVNHILWIKHNSDRKAMKRCFVTSGNENTIELLFSISQNMCRSSELRNQKDDVDVQPEIQSLIRQKSSIDRISSNCWIDYQHQESSFW